ncbi:MAG: hypothetical protein E6K74_02780, partial [Candidatus Eisenbacteria bacterium]
PSDLFGFSAGSAGDFDGDGYQDFAVGAPFRGIGGIDLYWGGPNADSVADLHLLQSNSQEGLLGFLTAPAGDFNGDGFEDIVAGLESGSLRFIVFYGGQAPDPFPDLPLSFPGSGYACEAVAAGDVNHDGYSDIIAGYGTPYSPGRVFIYFGGPGGDCRLEWRRSCGCHSQLSQWASCVLRWTGHGWSRGFPTDRLNDRQPEDSRICFCGRRKWGRRR